MNINYVPVWGRAKKTLLLLSTATLLALPSLVRADSPSDLMEQGIFSEETKGDLDAAVQLYQKVVAQSKADQTLAAQAQYHLGVCFYKEKKYSDAETAFAAVVKEYPGQKDIIALAQKYLTAAHALQPAPWTDHENMRMDLKVGGGLKIGMEDYRIDSGQTTNGQKIWRCATLTTVGGMQAASHVEVDAETFAPLHGYWKHTLLGEVDTTYYPDHADLKTTGKDEVKKIEFDTPVIDNEEAIELMRRLPLADGYKGSQKILSGLGSQVITVKWEVTGPEKIEVPAGTYNCYKVALNINQTFWISADANRYLVKFEGGGAIAELTGVTHHGLGEKAAYSDTNGISMISPPGWIFDREEVDQPGETAVRIIDPEVKTVTSLAIKSRDAIKSEEKKSLRAYAEGEVARSHKTLKDFQVRADGWKDQTLAGQPALSVTADFTEGKIKSTVCGIFSFGTTNVVYLQMVTAASDFDAFKPKMDAIVDSLKVP